MEAGSPDATNEGHRLTVAPDDAACWRGDWQVVAALDEVWAQAATARTVRALPQLHPWRLGDDKGSSRLVQWVGRWPADPAVLGVLAVTARDPGLSAGEADEPAYFALTGGQVPSVELLFAAKGLIGRTVGDPPRWAGVLVRLAGSWLPPIAWLPRALRDLDDPRTAWPTESVDFAQRYTVHCADLQASAALLTPAVMALLLDAVPAGCAVTLAGDAMHLWWPHRGKAPADVGRVSRAASAGSLVAQAFPHFVLKQFPDRSDVVEAAVAERNTAARNYRADRRPGRSNDPVMQRIYDQARAKLPPA